MKLAALAVAAIAVLYAATLDRTVDGYTRGDVRLYVDLSVDCVVRWRDTENQSPPGMHGIVYDVATLLGPEGICDPFVIDEARTYLP